MYYYLFIYLFFYIKLFYLYIYVYILSTRLKLTIRYTKFNFDTRFVLLFNNLDHLSFFEPCLLSLYQ